MRFIVLTISLAVLNWTPAMEGPNQNSSASRLSRISGVQIDQIVAYDDGTLGTGSGTYSIDVTQGTCGSPPDEEDETFNDTLLGITLSNSTSASVRIRRVRIRIPGAGPGGKRLKSGRLSPLGNSSVPAGNSSTQLLAFFLDVDGAGKTLAGTQTTIDPDLGLKNVSVIVSGRTGTGKRFRKRARSAFVFRDIDRCGS